MARVLAEGSPRWNDLTLRVLSALVLLPVAVFCVWSGGFWFVTLVLLAVVGMAVEWAAMCRSRPFVLAAGLVAAVWLAAWGAPLAGLAMLAAGLVIVPRLRMGDWPLAAGFPYLGLAGIALVWLRDGPAGWPNTLFILVIIWGSDIGAYMIGRLIGGPKLAPAISPGKTVSGAIGGLVTASLAGLAVAACFSSDFSSSRVIILTCGLGVVSQAGDLLESALKRHFGVKDSGALIPGHGGLLDRLDALLAVAPAAAGLALVVEQGGVLWR